MSHQPERTEKNCLNCGTDVHGRYCHVCGQENTEPKETVSHIAGHFFSDLTHFDGKFFTTMKDVLFKPGFLSREYIIGRRMRYVNPIRLYLFTSAAFFLVFFSFFHKGDESPVQTTVNGKTVEEISAMDSATFASFTTRINVQGGKPAVPMTRGGFQTYLDSVTPTSGLHIFGTRYQSRKTYDSALKAGKQHSWLERQLVYKQIDLNEKYHHNSKEITAAFSNALFHSLPQMLFISLPLLALLLRLLYVRRRKEFFYVSHFIFSVHLYIFLFIAIFVSLCLSKLKTAYHWGVLSYISALLSISILVYTYAAMKNFYRQGWLKTGVKFFLLNVLFFFVLGILFMFLALFSLFKI